MKKTTAVLLSLFALIFLIVILSCIVKYNNLINDPYARIIDIVSGSICLIAGAAAIVIILKCHENIDEWLKDYLPETVLLFFIAIIGSMIIILK